MGTAPRSLSLEAAGSGCVQSRGLESSKGIQMARGRRCPWRDTGQAHREEAKPQAASPTRGGERQAESLERDFPGGPVVKNPPYNAEDVDWMPVGGLRSNMLRSN